MNKKSSEIRKLDKKEFPEQLLEIPQPPKELFIKGNLPDENSILLCVVGSRKHTSYGKDACEKIISGLRGNDIVIVSGLALGIDSIAHRAAIDANLKTIAIPGSGLDTKVLYPKTNFRLANEIIEKGGALLSEFKPDFEATPWSFPQRNRIMAGLSQGVLIIEASEKSGTLITARMALDYNKDVYTIPASIFSQSAKGSNRLIKQGATPITSSNDLLDALGLEIDNKQKEDLVVNEQEKNILTLLIEPIPKDDLIRQIKIPIGEANALLSIMEIKGLIKERLGKVEKI